MKRRHFLPLLALAPLPTFAVGSLDAAQTRLRSAIDEVLAIALKAKDRASLMAQIGVVLERHISFAVMTRRAVGPGWRQFIPAQQSQAIASFSRLIIRSYGNKFTIGEKPQIDYKSAAATGEGRVDVSTTTTYHGAKYKVVYRLEEAESWRTTDVVIEGVSMVANYRSQLDPVFKRGGADAVIKSLETSAAKSE